MIDPSRRDHQRGDLAKARHTFGRGLCAEPPPTRFVVPPTSHQRQPITETHVPAPAKTNTAGLQITRGQIWTRFRASGPPHCWGFSGPIISMATPGGSGEV